MRTVALMFCFLIRLSAVEPVAQRDAPKVIYAMGDVHGDFERMVRLLHAGRLIDANNNWAAGDSVLVVTGDMIDKGPRPVDVLRFLSHLRNSAPHTHGQVLLLAGNHEAEFLAGPDQKKSADFVADLKQHGISPQDVRACRGDIGELLCSLPFAARVGEWFFCHGGNTGGRSLARLEDDLKAGITAHGYRAPVLLDSDSLLESRLSSSNNWFSVAGRTDREVLTSYAAALGVKHLVQGHQPKAVTFDDGTRREAGEMFQYQGLLFLIDVGMSRGVGNSAGALLEIRSASADAVCPDGTLTGLWNENINSNAAHVPVCPSR